MTTQSLRVCDFAEVMSGGTPATSQPDNWSGTVPWVTPKDMSQHASVYIAAGSRFLSQRGLRESSARLLPPNTVILSSRAPVGYVAVAAGNLATNQGCKNLVCRDGVAHPTFVYYLLKNSKALLEANATGSTYKELSASRLKNLVFDLPAHLDVQQRIAAILYSYDSLIEINRRRIQLLERTARLLYKEWFVHLRFPGHDRTAITDGLPEGWERHRINDVCDTVGGGTPSTKVSEYWNGDITWVVPSDVTKNDSLVLLDSNRKITERGLRKSSARMVPGNTILMTSRASVGYFALLTSAACTNQGFINIVPRSEYDRMYLLFHLMSRVDEIRSNAMGTTYPEISKGRFRQMGIVMPSATLVRRFAEVVGDSIRQIGCLARSNKLLAQARDLLLPHLMNGEISV